MDMVWLSTYDFSHWDILAYDPRNVGKLIMYDYGVLSGDKA
jgi:hypothetical protein